MLNLVVPARRPAAAVAAHARRRRRHDVAAQEAARGGTTTTPLSAVDRAGPRGAAGTTTSIVRVPGGGRTAPPLWLAAALAGAAALAACEAPVVPPLARTQIDALRAESDAPARYRFQVDARRSVVGRAAVTTTEGRVVLVDDAARLVVVDGPALLDDVVGAPAALHDGRVVAARATEPGESDLWVVTMDGAPPRAIAAAHGADGQPFARTIRFERVSTTWAP